MLLFTRVWLCSNTRNAIQVPELTDLSFIILDSSVAYRSIQSGDIFTLTTDDPESRPLPSLELLEMQWILQRITAMSDAAGTPELDWDWDDDDDMNSRPTLIPDDNNGDIRSYSNRVYKWIPRPSLPGSVSSMA